jgi:hypothetical protein
MNKLQGIAKDLSGISGSNQLNKGAAVEEFQK